MGDEKAEVLVIGAPKPSLTDGTIQAAGLDVFNNEPHVAAEYLSLDNVTVFPHLGSGTQFAQHQMEQLVVDNVMAWADGRPPLTPVPETPVRQTPASLEQFQEKCGAAFRPELR